MSVDKQTKEKIDQFTETLFNVTHSGEQVFDNGLIVVEDKSKVKFEDIKASLKDYVEFDNANNHITFANNLVEVNKNKKTMLLNIEQDLDSKIISILKNISTNNSFSVQNFNNQEIFQLKLNSEFRIICFAKRSVIESKISYPYFYNLFGPVLSL